MKLSGVSTCALLTQQQPPTRTGEEVKIPRPSPPEGAGAAEKEAARPFRCSLRRSPHAVREKRNLLGSPGHPPGVTGAQAGPGDRIFGCSLGAL